MYVGGIFLAFSDKDVYTLFVVFSFCYTCNHQLKGEKRLLKQHLFSLRQVPHFLNPFWIQFKWWKVGEILHRTTNWKIVTNFSAPLLSHDHTWEQAIHFRTHLFCIEFPELWCKDAGNNFHTVRKCSVGFCILFYLKHCLNVTLLHPLVKLSGVTIHNGALFTNDKEGESCKRASSKARGSRVYECKTYSRILDRKNFDDAS